MAKARKIVNRTKAVRRIRRVTKTMEMVARVRFKRIHDKTVRLRPYTDRLAELVGDLANRGMLQQAHHPLLTEPEGVNCDVLLVLTSDRGLCGPYNSQVLHLALERLGQLVAARHEVRLRLVGRRGMRYLEYRGLAVDEYYQELGSTVDYEPIWRFAEGLMAEYLQGRISGLEIAYMQFIPSGRCRPAIAQVLPLSSLPQPRRIPSLGIPSEYELLPSPEAILAELLPMAVRLRIYQCFLDAATSEQLQRTAAMRSATENAEEMIHDLTVQYNRLRQSQITTELSEIVAGRPRRR